MVAISQEIRSAVERDLRAGELSLQGIADAHGVSKTSVRRIAERAGIDQPSTAQAKTKTAREVLKERNALLREEIATDLLEVARTFVADLRAQRGTVVTGVSFGEPIARRYDLLSPRDAQALATAAGIALDKHRMLDTYDQDRDTTEVGKFLRALAGGEA